MISMIPSHTHTLLQDMHIISTDEKQVFAAVQEWNQNNTYSLYISDSPGVYFTLSLENLRTSRGPAGNLLVDFYKVCSRRCWCSLFKVTDSTSPQFRNTRSWCKKTCIFPPQQFSVSLYQKEEDVVFSPIAKDGTFISLYYSLLPLNLLDCGLVFIISFSIACAVILSGSCVSFTKQLDFI